MDLKTPIVVNEATEDDSKIIFAWRNDEKTRAMSRTTNEIDWEEHSKWYEATLQNENCCVLMCSNAKTNQQMAVVRFDVEDEVAQISINLSPFMRGKGLANTCLSEAITYFSAIFKSVSCIEAEIKPINIASRKAFEGAGFGFKKESDGMDVLEYLVDRSKK